MMGVQFSQLYANDTWQHPQTGKKSNQENSSLLPNAGSLILSGFEFRISPEAVWFLPQPSSRPFSTQRFHSDGISLWDSVG